MARNLARAGYGIVAHDVDRDALRRARDASGAEAPGSLETTASRCEAVITMLPDGEAVRAVVLGPGGAEGLLAGFPRGSVLIDMSSSSPLGTRARGRSTAGRQLDEKQASSRLDRRGRQFGGLVEGALGSRYIFAHQAQRSFEYVHRS